MTVRNYTVGDGMTEKPGMSFDGVDDLELPEVKAAIETGTLDGLLRSLERECFEIMAEAGLPQAYGSFQYDVTGNWTEIDIKTLGRGGWRIANEHSPIAKARGFADHSLVGFASARLGNLRALRLARQRGDHDYAIQMGFYLGVQQAELRLKRDHEKAWRSGTASTAGASLGGKVRGSSDKIMDRRAPLIESYHAKRALGWEHDTAKRYAIDHASYGSEKPLSAKQATRILNELK
jgi:hypothetical protein